MTIRLVALFLAASFAWAQADANRGAVHGRVSDSAGAAVSGAQVLAIQTASGLERTATTDTAGRFQVSGLLPGDYEIRVQSGTVSAIVRDVGVRVGTSLQVNVSVALQNSPDAVNVATSVLSLADADLTQVVPFAAIRDLPINGRRFQEFATLTPTVTAGPETLGQISFLGQRAVYSNVLLDGTDYNEPFLGGIRGGDRASVAFTVPQSAVGEFQAVTSGYSAEYGRSTGGVLNAITRSGSNVLHGESFYLMRDGALAASTPLGRSSLERQQQFGGAVGGPAIRNKLFWFGAAEQQFARFPRDVQFGVLNGIARTPDVAPALDYFRSLEQPFQQTNNATAVLGRGDYHFGGSHVLSGRYQYSRNNADNATALGMSVEPVVNRALSNNGFDWDAIRTIGGQLTSAFRPTLLNDLRVQHSFEHRRRVPNLRMPLVDAGSIGSIGTPALLPYRLRDTRFQIADGVTVLAGAHSVKFGADYSYLGFYQWFGDNQTGAFVISNPDPTEVLRILSRSGGPQGNRLDDPSVIYRRQIGVLGMQDSAHQIALFVQDTWRVRHDVTLNAGLRWEGQVNPSPDVSNTQLVNTVANFAYPRGPVDPTRVANGMRQWAPRLGFAWSPAAKATTIRAQAGIFYGQTPLALLIGPLSSFSNTPTDLSVQASPGSRGTIYQQFLAAGIDLNATAVGALPITTPAQARAISGQANSFSGANVVTTSGENFRNPRSGQLSVGVQHQFTRGLSVDYQMTYVNTNHLVRNIDYNVPFPGVLPGDLSQRAFFGLRSGSSRPNPGVGQVLVRDSSAKSRYTGHSFRVQWQTGRVQLAANYTLSYNKSDDDGERALSGLSYGNPYDFSREYNWSSLDSRHMASGYILVRAPWGFTLSSLFRYRSGLPIDPTTGSDSAELLSGSAGNRPMERPGLPFLRNSFRNADFKTVDVRILKTLFQRERVQFQFTGEVFNVFNFENVAFLPSTVLPDNPAFRYGPGISANGQIAPVNPGFLRLRTNGTYDASVAGQQGTPLQGQLGLRLLF